MKTLAFLASFALFACSGDVVVDPNAGGGGAGSGAGSTVTGCDDHGDCGEGRLCIFATGTCADACVMDSCDSCGAAKVCSECATSSCPGCRDCTAACAPKQINQCDDDDDCDSLFVCNFGERRCDLTCSPELPCPSGEFSCLPCATGSCCGCKNCVSSCVPNPI
jgi:hypothetical protein